MPRPHSPVHRPSRARGFTLGELVLVVAILGILATVAVPAYLDMRAKAEEANVETLVGAIKAGRTQWLARAFVAGVNQYSVSANVPLSYVVAVAAPAAPVVCESPPSNWCRGHSLDRTAFAGVMRDPGADLFADNPYNGNTIEFATRTGRTLRIVLAPATNTLTWTATPAY